ncbi:MAG TPA: biotin/lipoyl-containing protein [Pedobacter sp.]|uniref:acetyl-CoA carboxylase biotin carboxyl carrier protein subunit n=1 Tax=Pedobacter sp. TaxID=1411316 RepID=UPI002B71623C|nr:biotin/lipoyl-containing protein [Pedobacter sp.]HMI04461.1 biotin/lipoyl-containing protein [Pedobacter sp.]
MKVKVNEQYNFDVELNKNRILVNGTEVEVDSRPIAEKHTHVIYNHRSYNIEIVEENRQNKTCTVKVNGNIYGIKIEDSYDQLLKQLGMDTAQTGKIRSVKAPMPGLVLNIMAKEGATVTKGDGLLILEAMKMENMIKSPADGIIKKISITKGDKVEKNDVLIEFN